MAFCGKFMHFRGCVATSSYNKIIPNTITKTKMCSIDVDGLHTSAEFRLPGEWKCMDANVCVCMNLCICVPAYPANSPVVCPPRKKHFSANIHCCGFPNCTFALDLKSAWNAFDATVSGNERWHVYYTIIQTVNLNRRNIHTHTESGNTITCSWDPTCLVVKIVSKVSHTSSIIHFSHIVRQANFQPPPPSSLSPW